MYDISSENCLLVGMQLFKAILVRLERAVKQASLGGNEAVLGPSKAI